MRGSTQRRLFAGLCLLLFWQSGCAAFRPVHGVPARYLPAEMKFGDRSQRRTIDLSLLRQSPPTDPTTGKVIYRIDTGDVLGVYVEGFVGNVKDPPPVFFPQNGDTPSFGLPYPVRDDGTISLPYIGSLNLRGMTLVEAEEKVKQAYLSPKQLINPDHHRVQVNLQRPRQYRVLVIRQDSRNEPPPNGMLGQLNIGMVKRGTGKVVNLPAYTNDVLNALTATDGLPGLDAENAVIVIRGHGAAAQGGALDPRWPTDLVPSLMMRGAQDADTVIRGQSPDERGNVRPQNVMQARYVGPPSRTVQQVNETAPDGYGNAYGSPMDGQTDPNASLAPPAIWPDRAIAPAAFNPSVGQGNYPPGMAPNAGFPQFPADSMPSQPYGPGWNAPVEVGPRPGQPSPYSQAAPYHQASPYNQSYNQSSPDNMGQPAGPGGMNAGAPSYGQQPYPGQPGEPASNAAQSWGPQPLNPQPPNLQPGNPQDGLDGAPRLRRTVPDIPPGLGAGHGIAGVPIIDGRHVIRIPIRLGPGETADIRPEDVVLYDGDIVFIESRDTEVFYTGGLLGGGQYMIPRDYDLDILQALSLAQSRGITGASRAVGGVSALNNDVAISPSTCIVLRKLPDGGEIPVKIDLYRARTDLAERIVIQPGDYILLQYTPLEAIAAFFERHLLETAIFGLAAQQFNRTSTTQ